MDELKQGAGPQPRFERGRFLLLAGFAGRYNQANAANIPQLWEQFAPFIGQVPGQVDDLTYGICCNADGQGAFDYVAAVEISKLDDLPERYRWVEVQPQHYAVFEHQGALQTLPQTFHYIWKTWLPQSGREAADAPEFERYSADFDPATGDGVLEIWLPLKAD